MIEPPQSANHSTRRANRLTGSDPLWGLTGDAGINRAVKLASDLQQILSFVDREYNRPTRAAPLDQSIEPPDRPVESPREAAVHRHEMPSPTWQPPEAPIPESLAPEASPPTERVRDSVAAALESIQLESTQRDSAPARRNQWLSALQLYACRDGLLRKGPWLVSAALSTLIAVDLARASMSLFFGGLPTPSLPVVAIKTRAPERPPVDVRSIIAAQLFGVFAADPSSQEPSGAPQTAAHLRLAGTLATENPKTGLAIISDTGPAEVYKVGASVDGASLQSVYRDRVILSRNGRLETLLLPAPSLGKGRPAATAPSAPRVAESDEHASADAGKGRNAGDVMRTSASLSSDGRLRGFRVYAGGNRMAFDKSGLRGGDLVVAVNGASLQDQDRKTGQEMLNTLVASGSATLTIERNGERHDVTVYAPDGSSPPE